MIEHPYERHDVESVDFVDADVRTSIPHLDGGRHYGRASSIRLGTAINASGGKGVDTFSLG
jgi:hypothetical protein